MKILWNSVTAFLGLGVALNFWIALRGWPKATPAIRAWTWVAAALASTPAVLWVSAVLYSSAGGDVGYIFERKSLISQLFGIALLTGTFGTVIGFVALAKGAWPELAIIFGVAFASLAVWMIWATMSY